MLEMHGAALDRDELRVGLRGLGVELGERELDSVMRAFGSDQRGRIDFDKFYKALVAHRCMHRHLYRRVYRYV